MLLAAGLLGFLASRSVDTAFAAPCATPGTDGPAGTLTGIVNTYYPGTANAAAGATSISVGTSRGAATAIAAGDLLLVIQMQDAAINSTDTDSYGDGVAGGVASGSTSVNSSGKFEYVRATGAVTAGAVAITGAGGGSGLVNSYVDAAATGTQGQRRFQVIRVPQYSTATLGSGLTAAGWNGATGGILAVDVTGTLALGSATVDVTGLGFRGGGARQLTGAGGGSNTAYRSLATAAYHAQKGEGIAGTPRYVRNGSAAATDTGVEGYPNGSSARGAPGNAGGGGTDGNPATNDQNSGGGGGANGGTGGQGGNTWSSNLPRGGYGGTAFAGSVSQLVLGGGGGAGTRNNTPSVAAASAGGNGGGMVMLRAGNLSGTGTITADGQSGVVPENDAGGGAGAGGSVMVLSAGGGTGGLTVNARGAVGGDAEQATSGSHGPGGGGGGGVVVLSGAAAGVNVGGGAAGDTNNGSGTFIPYGATAGTNGSSTTAATLAGVPGTSAGTECTPQLTVTKTTSTPVVVDSGAGGTATYTITVANAAGRAPATNTSISDALPAGFTFASTTLVTLTGGATRPSTSNPTVGSATPAWGTFTIPGGGQVQITFTTTVAAGTTPATYQNPATATYTDPARATAGGTTSASYNPAGSTGEDVQVRLPIANVGITKTVSAATPALNTNVTFTVTVSNGGPELARAVSVADALPAGLTFVSATPSVGTYSSGTGVWTVGNLNNGASATLSLVATVTTHTLLTNTATASTTSTDPVAANNSASATVNVPDANLAVTKSVSNATPAINTNVTFTVGVTNGGPDTAQAVVVADLLPAGLTFVSATPSTGSYNSGTGVWTVGNLANGASASLSLVATVTTHTLLTNTATVSATTYDPTGANNSASATVNVPDANLSVAKSVSNATPAVGSNVTFTVTVSNGGPNAASAVSVADLLPAGLTFVSATPSTGSYNSGTGVWTVGNLANGASASLSLVATVTTHTSITNTATVFTSTFDPISGNDSASASVNAPDANLAVTKSVSSATPAINTNVTFTVTVSNGGPDAASAVSVADLLPAGLTFVSATPSTGSYNSGTGVWTVGNLANGASASLSLVATVTTHTLLTNTATVSATTYDPTGANNSASATVNVPDANLAVTKSVSNATPAINTNVTFTVGVTNGGPDAASAVSVADLLPAGLTFVSATPSTGSYNSGTGVWTVGNLANGASASLSLVATVTTHTLLTNTATVSATTYDPTGANNSASATVNVPDANLAVTKSVSNATPAINTNVTFTVTVSNGGPDAASAVSVADLLPAGLTFVSATPSTGSYNSGTGVWTVGNLANGASASLSLVATVTTHTSITNTASVSSSTYDPVAANNSASATVNVPDANLAVTKSVSNATPAINTNVTFTVGVTNGGPDTAQAVVVADLLPAGLTFVSATPSTGSYNSGTGVWTVGNLANGASASLSLVATVTTHTSITNTASVSSSTYDPVAANNSASATVNVPDANLAVTKSVSNATPAINTNVTFTVGVTNGGPDTAQAVVVADLLPAGLTFVSATPSTGSYNSGTGVWTVGNLANGASASLSLVATVTTHTSITNTASVSSSTYDPVAANNSASATVNVPDANLAVTKSVSNATPAINTNVTFTVGVTNGGPDTAQAVVVADLLPAGLTFVSATPSTGSYNSGTGVWTVGNLANGASASLSLVATVTTHTSITNTASVSSSTYDPVAANNSASATVNVPDANLAVTKSVSNATPAINTNVTFTVGVTNGGPDTAQAVVVADLLPAGLTFVSATPSTGSYNSGTGVWTVGNLANGASASLSLVATVTTHTLLTNTATVSATTYDPTGANNSASATVNVPDANLAVTKTVNDPTPEIGANVTFTVTVTNNGPDAASGVAVADALPAGLTFVSSSPSTGSYNSGTGTWTVGNLANGASATLGLVATVAAPGSLTNTATASSSTFDPVGGNNAASASVNARQANLAVTKTVSNATPAINTNVTFTVTATNNGPDAASGVAVADALPAGLSLVSATPSSGSYAAGVWTIGNLANGASATLTIVATVTTHTVVTNSATVSATTHDPVAGNNTASAAVNVPDANLAVTKTVNDATPALNDIVTFTVTVTNGGPDAAQSVSVADALPAGLSLVSATPSVGSYAAGIWTVGNLANGGSANLQLLAQVTSHLAITNTAAASSSTFDPVAANNADSATVNVPDADLAVTKTVNNPTPALGTNVAFTVTLTNNGPNAAVGVAVTDALPAGLTLVSATPSAGTYSLGIWNVGTVANGASPTLVIVATVTSHTQITNTATAAATTYDPVGANNAASASVDVPDANLAVTKTVNNPTPAINTNVTFTVTVTNNGPDAAQGASVADLLPAGLAFVSATPSTGTYASGPGVWTVGNLANGASATLSIVATVTTHTAVTNTATASSATYDPTPGNDTASATVNVPDANLAVTKTVDTATPDVGGNVTFTVTVSNAGPDTAQAATVIDVLPAGLSLVSSTPSVGSYNNGTGVWAVGNLANGANATLTIVATATAHTPITNTATASSSTFDPVGGNNSDSVTVNARDADLAVTKVVDDPAPAVGGNVTFTVTVANAGPDTAQSVSVADALPAGLTFVSASTATGTYASGTGTWTVGALANGASATLDIVATVVVPTLRTNTATVTSTTFDPSSANNTDSASVDARDADLAITKSVDDSTPSFGGQVTFLVTVTNNGPDAATGVSVADALPAGLSLVSATPSQGSYAAGTWTVGSITSGANATLAIVAAVTTHTAVTNTATVSATTNDPVGANNTASSTVDVPDADLAIAKTANTATPAVGTNVTFLVTLTNNGSGAAQAAAVADALPAGLTFVSATPSVGTYSSGTGVWAVGSLANGATATLSVVATVNIHTAITNTATVSSGTYDPVPANDSASAVVNAPDADVSITKTVDNAAPALGANVTFTLTVANGGPSDAATAVSVVDALPTGLTFVSATPSVGSYASGLWTIGTLANGATATMDIVATVTTHTALTNTATVSSATFDPAMGNNSASAVVNVPDANLAVAKTVSDPAPPLNSNVTFTVTVTNAGPNSAAGVAVADSLPAGLSLVSATPSQGTYGGGTWAVGTVANGASATLDIVATVTVYTQALNTATVSATTYDPVPGDNVASASVNPPNVDLVVTKVVDDPNPSVGQDVTFTVTVTNNGPDDATGVAVADALPSGLSLVGTTPSQGTYAAGVWTVGSLANGATATIAIVGTVDDPNPLTNTATTTATQFDPVTTNNSSFATVNAPDSDLALTKTVDDPSPSLGGTVTFLVSVTSNGPDDAANAHVDDLLPPGLAFLNATPSQGSYNAGTGVWTIGAISNGDTETLSIVAQVTTDATTTNTASVVSELYDANPANSTDSVTVDVPDADLAIAKTVDNSTPAVGSNLTFTVTVANNGPDSADGVSVADALPAGLTLVSATPSQGGYAAGTWTVGTVGNGASATLAIVATVTGHGPITNTATVTATTHDPATADNTAAAQIDAPDADLLLTKIVSDPAPPINTDVSFTVTVTNSGPDTAAAVTVADTLPTGLTLVSATPSVGTYSGGVWTVGSLANGANATLVMTATVGSHTPITNTATASSSTFDPVAGNNSQSATVDVPDADLAVTKTVDDPAPALGSDVTFTVAVANNGPNAAAGVSVADALPAGLTLVSATPSVGTYSGGVWTVGPLANGSTGTLVVVATVTGLAPITNTATASSSTFDPVAGNNSQSATVDVPDADLAVTKTVDDPAPALGSDVTFTVAVANNGPNAAAGVSVADALPAGLTLVSATPSVGTYSGGVWTVGPLANGASATLTVVATVTTHTPIVNTATASSATQDAVAANNTSSVSVDVANADLGVTKSVNSATPPVGGSVTFTVTVANNGPDGAVNVAVSDPLPAGTTFISASPSQGSYNAGSGVWLVGSLANGATATATITASVTTHLPVTNTATASTSTYDPVAANDAASAGVNAPDADLAITKVVDDASPELGDPVTFTVSVVNNGPNLAQGVAVADTLPSGLTFVSASTATGSYDSGTGIWTVGDLPNGATATLDIDATVSSTGQLTNTATVSASTFDPAPGNNTDAVALNARQADLAVTKTVNDANPVLGANVVFTVTVANNGPDGATGVSVADTLPAGLSLVSASPSVGTYGGGTWTIGTLPNGASATLTVTATVTTHVAITNTATVAATTDDPNSANNTDAATVDVPDADLVVTKSVDNAAPEVGANVTFTVTLANAGPDTAVAATVADALPPGLTLVSATPTAGSYAAGVWSVGNMANGASETLTIVATPTTHLPVTNTASAASATDDPVSGNNSSSAGIDARNADLALTKSVNNPAPVLGSNVTFTVAVTNSGPDAAQAVAVTDVLPAGLTLVAATPSFGSFMAATGVWTVGTLANGATATLDIVATVTDHTSITNTATLTTGTFDPSPGDHSGSATVDAPDSDLSIVKSVDTATPQVGDNVIFTLDVTNNGPDAATGVSVTDVLPAGLSFVSAAGGSYNAGTGVWNLGALANGATASLTITAQVTSAANMTNIATVAGLLPDPDPADNTSSVGISAQQADLAVTKIVDNAAPAVGANVTFTVTVANSGPDTAQATSVADALPPGLTLVSATPSAGTYAAGVWSVGPLASGDSETLQIVATVTTPTAVTNTATASSTTFDPDGANNAASVSVDARDADLMVNKNVDDPTPSVGGTVTFLVSVTNLGPDTAGGVSVTDALPAGTTLFTATPSVGSYDAGTGVWTIGTLGNGAIATLAVVARVNVPAPITNTATVSTTTTDPVPGNDSASVGVDARDADLVLTKSVDDPTPEVGGNVTFTVTVTNNGPDTAQTVSVADALPPGLSFVSATPSAGSYDSGTGAWIIGNLANGATATLDIVATATTHTPVTNTADVTTSTFDATSADHTDSAVVDARNADLTINKSVDDPTPEVGSNVVFTVSATNNGPDAATGVVVQDQPPAGLTFVSASSGAYNSITGAWPVGTLASGATATLTITATVTDHLPITNTATVAATTFDPATADNSDSVVVNARDADLAVTKSVDDPSPALGGNVTFTLSVHNNGPDTATAVAVSDPLPAGLAFLSASTASGGYSDTTGQWTVGALANGATATLSITARVDDPAAITNTAAVSSTTHDPVVANDTDAVTVDVAEADLEVTKTVDNAAPALNGTVRFTVTVTNHGPDAATQVSVAEALPAGLTLLAANPSTGTYSGGTWTVGTIANGATVTLLVDARVTVSTPVVNTATATSSTHDPVTANNSATAGVDVPNADLTLSKLVDDATPNINDDVTFTITVANNGPDASAGVSVADALPAGLTLVSASPSIGSYGAGAWNVGTIANGASETLTIVATVTVPTPITNTATVSATTLDPVGANDSSSAAVDVPDADLAITKTVDDPSPSVGANVTFTVGIVNHGPDAGTATVVTDALPAGLAFVSATPSTGTYDSGTGIWSVGLVANGATATLDIVAQVTTAGGVTNTATVSATEYDATPANNTASATVAGAQADLAMTKTVSDTTPGLGANVTFAVAVTNNGPDSAANVTVDDLLPPGLVFVSAAPSTGTYNQGTGVWAVGNLVSGATRTLDIVATVAVTTPVLNVAAASSPTFDPNPANNNASAAVDVQNADVAVTKTVDNPAPSMNGTVTYLVTATNNGPDTAAGVSVADPLPSGLTLVSATPSVGTYSGATGTWAIGSLANGASATLTILAQVTVHTPVNNLAGVTSSTYDAVAANDSAAVAVDVPDADLTIAKTVDDATPALGSDVTFTVTVGNAGPDAAAGVSVADALPAGLTYVSSTPSTGSYSNATGVWTIGSLANGATATLDITATVTSASAITNTATVSSSTNDPAGPNSASATVDVPQADLAVTKGVDDPTPALGANVTFTIVVTNHGPDQATGVSVADALPAGLNLVSATPSTGTYSSGVWTLGTLANGASETLQIDARVVTGAPVTNTATASATTLDPNLANNSDSAGVDVADADLAVTKSVDDTTPNLGATVHFTITVTNNGPDAAAGVRVADALPAGLAFLAATPSTGSYAAGVWTVGNMANGANETLDVAASVASSATITNTATVTSDAFDGIPANDDDSAAVDAPDADLSVVKSVDDPTPSLNGTVTFLVSVTNHGPDAAPAVSVADTLPAGLTQLSSTPSVGTYSGGTWTIGPLANGATETLSVAARVTSSALITNTATVTSGAGDPNPADDTSSASVDVPEADLAVAKTVDNPAPALNSDVTFTVTVANNGPNPAVGVSVADALPAGLTLVSSTPSVGTYSAGVWAVGPLPSGASETLDVTATVTGTAAITNTATVSSGSFDGTPNNDTASAMVDVPEADLAIQKTVSDPTPAMNGTVTFTLTVTNNGPSLAQAVLVNDALPSGLSFVSASSPAYVADTWTVGDLPNGSTATLDIVAQVVDPALITNTATVSSATLDPVSGNDSDAAQVDVPEADLRLTKTVDDPTPNEGQDVTYTLSLVNNGPNAASAVAVTDLLPAGLTFISANPQAGTYAAGVWNLASVASGATRQLEIVARVDIQGIVTNNAEVTASGTFDPTSTPADGAGDDFATVDIDALPPEADLSLTKSVSDAAPAVGGSVTYTLAIRNDGPSATGNVSVIDLLPVGVTYVSSTATQGTYDAGGGTWTVGAMASGATETLTIVVTVDQAGTIVNSAEIGTSDETDPDSTPANAVPGEDDQASVQLTAQGTLPQSADLEIVKSASSPVANFGDTISYAIIVTNRGPAAATNVQVLEQLPLPLEFVSARASAGAYDLGTGVWSIPAIANGASASLIVTTHVVGSGAITNTVQILASDQPDPDGPFNPVPGGPGGEQSSATVSVTPPPPPATRLRITKTGPSLVKAGGTVTFTIVVRNNGTVPATVVQLNDCIPTGFSLMGKLTNGKLLKGRLAWRFGTLQPGQSRTVRVRFRVDRDTRGMRGCAAISWGTNAAPVRAVARVRVVAGASRPTHTPVAG